ncbi:MAG: MFS transporter [Bradyrhizobiaceae bacterium]|nr:MFS transporter [Bradyrhizobiaceae bacterium]
MSTTTQTRSTAAGSQFVVIILVAGCAIGVLSFGPRAALGLFLPPMVEANAWGRDVFALALAVQILLWGASQPVAGALADRFGPVLVLSGGAVLYSLGLALMAYSTTPAMLNLSAGVLAGFGIAGSSFTIVIAAFSRLLPVQWRSLAFGAGTAAGSFGQFLFSPLAVGFIHGFGWQNALLLFAAIVLLIIPLSLALATPKDFVEAGGAAQKQSLREALSEALGHRSYVLLVLGFFTCGFQLLFITVHLPAYVVDRGLSVDTGAWTIGVIGLFNIIGSLFAGWLSDKMPKRYLLALIYLLRSLAVIAFISFPVTPASAIIFGAVMGFLWLSTVPPTSGLVALMFGTKWFATLFGVAFFSHQVGGFLGVWLGGVLYESFGSYDPIWWGSIVLGFVSAALNLPIVEKPVMRAAPVPA